MNRVSVRGVGLAAAAVAATSFVGAAFTPAEPAAGAVRQPAGVLATDLSVDIRGEAAAVDLAHAHGAKLWAIDAPRRAAARAARAHQLAVKRAAAQARVSRAGLRPIVPGSTRALGRTMAASRGWTGTEFVCLDQIWTHESNWRVSAHNTGSGAYGIPQAQPGSKMTSAGADWLTNPATQIEWGLTYIAGKYGNPCDAWDFWQSHHWY